MFSVLLLLGVMDVSYIQNEISKYRSQYIIYSTSSFDIFSEYTSLQYINEVVVSMAVNQPISE